MDLEATDAVASESGEAVGLPEGETTEEVGAPQAEQVEGDAPDYSQLVTVKVAGGEEQVTLQEALNGYQRQADYTQKTQALATEREQLAQAQQLWQAIENNPEQTIGKIAEAYGLHLTPAQEQELEAQREELDPTEQRLRNVEQFAQQAQQTHLQAQIDRELVEVHTKYGVQFQDDDLLQYALDHQIGDLDTAFRAFAFEQMTNVAKNKQITQKKQTSPPIAGGHGVASGVVSAGPGVGQRMSIADAFAAAEAAHDHS